MTKGKFLFLSILFFVSLSSFGTTNEIKYVDSHVEKSSVEISQEIENISPPFDFKLAQKVKACHKNKIGHVVAGVVVGVGFLGFIVWAIAADV